MNGLLEILTNKHWMIQPDFVQNVLPVIQKNLNEHIAFEKEAHCSYLLYYADSGKEMRNYDYESNGGKEGKFVAMYYVDGPVTRNGGACSYGSKEIRDMMMENADNPDCLGHVFYINTPGGSASAINDFRMAIDHAHAKGQKAIAYIDGLCASAGMYIAALCDERYYMNPKDEIGCIGVMAAFYTEKDGTYNQYTNETFHAIYDPESYDKNKWSRDIANNNDDTLLVEELKALGAQFRADVKAACPNAEDYHLHGKMFFAAEVEGILVDGQKNLQEVFNRVMEISKYSPNNKQMTNNYQTIAKMMDVEELVVTEEGTHLDVALLDRLTESIVALQLEAAKVIGLERKVTDLQAQLAEANKADDEVKDGLNATIATLNETIKTNEETIAILNGQIATLNTEAEGAKAAIATAEQTIAERDQTIADLNAQIEEMQNAPGNEPDAGAAPDTNGEGAQAAHQASNAPQWDPNKSAKENKDALDEYERTLKAQLH